MDQAEILKIITDYLSSEFEIPAEKIKPEANLFEDLEMDSIDALDLASRMQSDLKVAPNRKQLQKIRTVQDVIDYIIRNRQP